MSVKTYSIFSLIMVIIAIYGENLQTKDNFQRLIKESKEEGLSLDNISPSNIKNFVFMEIQFDSKEKEKKFYNFQNKIQFIDRTESYPFPNNLIEVGLSKDKYDKNAQIIALRLLADSLTKLEKDKPSVLQVEDFLKNCEDMEIVIEGVLVLARLDKERGFIFANNVISNKKIALKDKMNLSCRFMPFEYTGGYVILQDLVKSNDAIIKLNVPMLVNYYEQYNGQKATNTEITIDTTSIEKEK